MLVTGLGAGILQHSCQNWIVIVRRVPKKKFRKQKLRKTCTSCERTSVFKQKSSYKFDKRGIFVQKELLGENCAKILVNYDRSLSIKVVEFAIHASKTIWRKFWKKRINLLVCHGPCAAKFFKYFGKNVGKVATTENFWEKKN